MGIVSCFLFLVSCFLFLVSCFLFLVSCFLLSGFEQIVLIDSPIQELLRVL